MRRLILTLVCVLSACGGEDMTSLSPGPGEAIGCGMVCAEPGGGEMAPCVVSLEPCNDLTERRFPAPSWCAAGQEDAIYTIGAPRICPIESRG